MKKTKAIKNTVMHKSAKKVDSYKSEFKLCQKCHAENIVSANVCSACGNKKFAPEFIKKIEKVIGNTFAQVTLPKESKEARITLYKWWPGGNASFNIINKCIK